MAGDRLPFEYCDCHAAHMPLLQGTILALAIFFVLMNFLVDLIQPLADPRIVRD